MSKTSTTEANIAAIRAMIDGPDSGLAAFMAENPYLRSAAEARDDLADLIVGLEDVRAGRVVSHDVVLQDVAERARVARQQAAE